LPVDTVWGNLLLGATIGTYLGLLLLSVLVRLPLPHWNQRLCLVMSALSGLVASATHACFIRRYAQPKLLWLCAGSSAWLAAVALALWTSYRWTDDQLAEWIVSRILGGMLIGLSHWLVLRLQLRQAGWLIRFTGLTWVVVTLVLGVVFGLLPWEQI